MKLKRWIALGLTLCMCVCVSGCSEKTAVYVQSVEQLGNLGGIAPGDRFTGLVVSENVTEIKKDADKDVAELLVKEGDNVTKGQKLFSYDTEQLQLNLDKKRLELSQIYASIESYNNQIAVLQQERNNADGNSKLQYTIEIQSTELNLKEAQLRVKAQETEIQQAEALLENSTVVSPIDGRVQSINNGDSMNGQNTDTYITIQQSGSYRIKGMLGELQQGGISEGDRLKISSRTDSSATWTGTVTLVDYENPSQGNPNDRYYGNMSDEMTTASRYPFYVQLEDTTGLILGQHVYMELETDPTAFTGPSISSAFIVYEEDGTAYVWVERRGNLEKRKVTLGEYDPMTDLQEIVDGLSLDDFIAFPDPELCVEGAPTTHELITTAPEEGDGELNTGDLPMSDGGGITSGTLPMEGGLG